MTIDIPDTIAQDIVAAFGRSIARSKSDGLAKMDRLRVSEFISALDPNHQDSCKWTLEETVKVWSEPKFSGDSERQATDSASASWNDSSNAMVGP